MAVHEFDPPERFVAGTVGLPGQRTFFLQARGGGRLTSVSLEKAQVSILADRVNDLLDQVAGGAAVETTPATGDLAGLEAPIDDEFRVMTLSLAWDQGRELVVIEAHDHDPDEAQPDADDPQVHSLRVVLAPEVARAFARRSQALVSAGRPPCPFCGQPLDPSAQPQPQPQP